MKKTIKINNNIPERLDAFLVSELNITRSRIQNAIKNGEILVNEMKVKTGYQLKSNDIITIDLVEEKALDIKPVNLKLDIIYEDDDVLVVNKPSGLVVHPASSYKDNTLVHGLLYQASGLSKINGVLRPGIVHRIDKDTSGLLLVAKNDLSHNELSKQLKNHEIKREYLALVHGNITEDEAIIETFIGRNPKNRLKMAVLPTGKKAITSFKVLERYGEYTYISCRLETGRTHQIRVHMSYIGYPLVGDPLYGKKEIIGDNGQFLHAHTLGFIHPTKKEYMEFSAPLPLYFQEFLDSLNLPA